MVAYGTNRNIDDLQTVLIISRDVELVSLWETFFEQKNYRVVSEATAMRGLQSAQMLTPALILLNFDGSLPFEEQLEICQNVRLTTDGTLILLAPERDKLEIAEYYRAGVDEFISTPVSPMALVIKCVTWLARQDWIVPRRQPIQVLV